MEMNAFRYRYVSSLGLIVMVFLAPVASADEETGSVPVADEKEEQAKRTFLEGKEAMRNGKHQEALRLFHISQKLFPTAGTTLNLALCEEQLGLVASAWSHFNELVNALPAEDPRVPIAKEGIATLAPKLPRLQILRAAIAPTVMTITLDGEVVNWPAEPAGIPLDPGPHVVRTKAENMPGNTYIFVIDIATTRILKIDAGIRPPPKTPASPMRNIDPGPSTPAKLGFHAGIALSVIGFAGIGIGAITGLGAIKRADQASTICPDPETGCPQNNNPNAYWALTSESNAYGLTSATALLLGGVWATAGVVVLSREKAPKIQLPKVIAAPFGTGVQVIGTF